MPIPQAHRISVKTANEQLDGADLYSPKAHNSTTWPVKAGQRAIGPTGRALSRPEATDHPATPFGDLRHVREPLAVACQYSPSRPSRVDTDV